MAAAAALVSGAVLAPAAWAAESEPSPADEAIEYRQALYTLIGGNFGPLGEMLQGHVPYNGAEAQKRAERVALLATIVGEAFPDISKQGHTKAKPEIWGNRADFDQKVQALVADTDALARQLRQDSGNVAAFKQAAIKVGQDCKACHDKYRAK
jgi:cytochrome c556